MVDPAKGRGSVADRLLANLYGFAISDGPSDSVSSADVVQAAVQTVRFPLGPEAVLAVPVRVRAPEPDSERAEVVE